MRTEQIELPASVRSEVGKSGSRRLRRQGKIPAVVYGRGGKPVPLAVEESAFAGSLSEVSWYSTLVKLRIEGLGGDESEAMVMIKEVQRDLVRRRVLSIDFQRISLQEVIHTQVPVIAVGQSTGVRQGGILEHIMHEVPIECLPTEIPDHLEADVSQMEIGQSLRVSDLVPPPGAKILAPPDEVVLVVAPPARVEEVVPAAAVEEGAIVEERVEPEVIREREREQESE